MQVLKEEMKNRIYEAAVREFSEKGFQQASMRNIAKGAGMTVGNLYRYFKDKEDLFYFVISPAYSRLMDLVKESIATANERFDTRFFEFLSEQILKICREHKIELLILFEGSKGTIYEKAKEEMILVVENVLKDMLFAKDLDKGIIIEDLYLLRVIAVGFVEGMIMITKNSDNDEKMKKTVARFITFYFKDVFKRFI